jgi:hypothetical protein
MARTHYSLRRLLFATPMAQHTDDGVAVRRVMIDRPPKEDKVRFWAGFASTYFRFSGRSETPKAVKPTFVIDAESPSRRLQALIDGEN